jgi:hypothetical protein
MFGTTGLIAAEGSFCLFCVNGDGGLPAVTLESVAANAPGTVSTAVAATAAKSSKDFLIIPLSP